MIFKVKKIELNNRYFDLQYFAEEDAAGDEVQDTDKAETEIKTLTQDQVNGIVAKRLAEEKAKWDKQYEQKLKEIREISTLPEEQRKELNDKLKAIEERERQIKTSENRIECENVLRSRGINPNFASFLLADGPEETLERINEFENMFHSIVKAEADKRIKGVKKVHEKKNYKEVSKEEFKKLSLFEQNKLYLSNPEMYKSYFN